MQGEAGRRGAVATRLVMIAAAVLAMAAPAARAQDAVVLSGGGARGLAHAGALAGIHARGYSPGLVVGTSMGAVVGALYAAGYSPDSIIALIGAEDWRALFTRGAWLLGPERSPLRALLELRIGDRGIRSAVGLIDDVGVNRRLVQLLLDASVRARGDFDRLPRRFRAVSTDLRDGSAVVPSRGDLARVTRASLAIPGVLAPIIEGPMALGDGGIASYLPVDIARSAGAARVLAVDVLRPPPLIVSSPLALATRAFRLILGNTLRAAPDYLIVPDIPQARSAAVFPLHLEPLIRAGELAALATLPPTRPPAPHAPRVPAGPPSRFARLVVETQDARLATLVASAFSGVAGPAYDPRRVLRAADRAYATGLFRGVWPRLEARGEDTVLVVRADAVPRTRLGVWAAWDADLGGRARIAIRHRPGRGALDLALEGAIGALESALSAEVRHSLTAAPPVAVTGGAAWARRDVRIFAGDRIVAEPDVTRAGAWIGLERRWIDPELHASLTLRGEHIGENAGGPGASDGFAWGPSLRFGVPASAPRIVGMPALLEADVRFGEVVYRRARIAGSLDGVAGPLLFSAAAEAAVAGGDVPLDATFALGDEHAVPGLRWGQVRGRTTAAGGFDLAYPIPLDGYLRLRTRAGFAAASFRDVGDAEIWIGGLGLAGLWYTPVGGVLLGAAVTDRGDWRIDFTIGGVPPR